MSTVKPPGQADALLTTAEVARRLNVGVGIVQRWARNGDLPGVELGGRAGWRFSPEDVEAFVARLRERRAI